MNKKIKLSLLGALIAGSALAITLPIVSCSSSTSSEVKLIITDEAKQAIIDAVTTSLNAKMQKDGINLSEQKALAATWKVGEEIHSEEKAEIDKIKDNIKFKDEGDKDFPYDDVVKSITFASEVKIGEFGTNISGPELKVNFKDGYTGDITIQVGDLGAVAASNLSVDDEVLSNVTTKITESLKAEMDKVESYEAQVALAATWKVGDKISDDAVNKIKDILIFTDGNNEVGYVDAVESITFATETTIGNLGDDITGPELKVNFNDAYIADVKIEVGKLGVVALSKVINHNASDLTSTNKKLTDQFETTLDLDSKADLEEQKSITDEFSIGTEFTIDGTNKNYLQTILDTLNFTNAQGVEVLGSEAIDKVVVTKEVFYPAAGFAIIGPELKVILKDGYTLEKEFTIEVGSIGTAKASGTTTP